MRPQTTYPALLALLGLAAAEDKAATTATTTATACTASSTSGAFYDLRPDMAVKAPEDGSKPALNAPTVDYKARGHDYGSNFTLNICGPVVEPVDGEVHDVKEELWRNISAYYVSKGDVYSLGMQSGELVARGKELVLQYTGGSLCGKKHNRKSDRRSAGERVTRRGAVHEGAAYKDYENDEDDEGGSDAGNNTAVDTSKKHDDDDDDEDVRRKSATIFFSCDKDPMAAAASVSFIATDPEECNYVFKVKSQHACAGAEPHKPGSVGPGPVFLIILVIAVLVYLLGGIFYNRTVSNARGWKQLPNYSLWAGVWSFITDLFFIALSSCARFLPSRRGYHYLAGSPNGRTRSSRDRDAENRLIDQLDEEWDD
ncbi:hypothetical protein DL770_002311 [Monosporascus sp. CRB-9-2]|nr:hypothetical protein DL770_002311 [Monosporascus sp. CRB-9-2]